jgi:hypothetical protein
MATTEAALPPDAPAVPPQSVTGLVSGILNDAQTLVRQQAEMLKAEMREDFRRSKRAAEFGSIGIVFATVGVMGLITALVYVLAERFGFQMWASWAMVGGLFAVVGAGLGWYSYVLLERFNPLPDKTFNALKENITWTTK